MPDKHRDAIVSLLQLPAEAVDELYGNQGDSPMVVSDLIELLGKRTGDGKSALQALTSLRLVMRNYDLSAAELVSSLFASFDIDDGSPEVLINLLSSETVEKLSKALDLRNAYERILTGSRILTDIRPVFPDDTVGESFEIALINHTLRLAFRMDADTPDEVYLAVDTSDLRRLRDQIDRALAKDEAAKNFIKQGQGMVLEPLEVIE